MFTRVLSAVFVLGLAVAAGVPAVPVPAHSRAAATPDAVFPALLAGRAPGVSSGRWVWPTTPVRIAAPYAAPANPYAAGHRGVDLDAPVGAVVRAPASGIVAFVGRVVDRDLLTIDHGEGVVITLEPVRTALVPGDRVTQGDAVAIVDAGGHSAVGTLHLGVRREGEYVNPLTFYGGVPRAVLLPCC